MNRWHRNIVRLAALLVAAAILVPAAQAGGNVGDAGLAQGILETHFGFSPSRAVDWTTGVCSYADRPGSCYLTTKQAWAQSYAEAQSMGVQSLPSSPAPVAVSASTAFHWGDAGIGAAATLGIVLILAGLGVYLVRGRRRHPAHA